MTLISQLKSHLSAAVVLTFGLSITPLSSADAHFQLLYTPEVNINRPGELPMALVFTHPFTNGHVMDMGKPLDFYALHKGKKIDLMDRLSLVRWQGAENMAAAYQAQVPIKRNGDYIFVVEPAPYYEASEDIYIQQITKSFVNKAGIPTGWEEPVGLKAEIVPLNKPYSVITGSTFTGQVLSDGKPVAGAEIEIEYIAARLDLANARFYRASVAAPDNAIVAITDDNGIFTFGIPKAGVWGFAALGVGPDTSHEGKELSQDAVIWVNAFDLMTQ